MDYEKKYNEALERAKNIKSKILQSHLSTESCKAVSEYIDEIIPELRESEDEEMLRTIIRGFENWKGNGNLTFNNTKVEDILAYLEKQKEQKQTDLPAGFYYIDLNGNRYYSKEFRYGDMKLKVGEQKPAWSWAVKWLVDDDYDELTDKGGFSLGSVGIGYNGYYIPYSDLLKLPKEAKK